MMRKRRRKGVDGGQEMEMEAAGIQYIFIAIDCVLNLFSK